MIKKGKKLFLIVIFICLFFGGQINFTFAQTTTVSKVKVDILVNENGNLDVAQIINYETVQEKIVWPINSEKITNLTIYSGSEIVTKNCKLKKLTHGYNLTCPSSKNNLNWIVKYKILNGIQFLQDFNEILWIFVKGNQDFYLKSLEINLRFKKSIDFSKYKRHIYALHGIGSYTTDILDAQTLSFKGTDLFPQTYFAISADFPSELTPPSFAYKTLKIFITANWVLFGLVIPFLSLIFLILFLRHYYKKIKIWKTKATQIRKTPPDNLLPAVAGGIIDQKIGAAELTATIIDLANRGYLIILNKWGKIFFGKRKSFEDLSPFEKLLGEKLFKEKQIKANEEEMKKELVKKFSDEKISEIFTSIYTEIYKSGYFIQNPALFRLKYRSASIGLFFLACLLFFLFAFLSPENPLILFSFVGMIIVSTVIEKIADLMPLYSTEGEKKLIEWINFIAYLESKSSATHQEIIENIFMKYFPYAIVFHRVGDWTSRFLTYPFTCPDWLVTDQTVTLETFVGEVFPALYAIGKELAAFKHPSIT